MLSPNELDRYPDALVELYAQVEADILADMAKRISAYGDFIPAAEWQFRKLQDMGNLHDDILKRLSSMSGKSTAQLKKLIKEAGITALEADDEIYRKAGLDPMALAQSAALQNVLEMGLQKTQGLFRNLTSTTANTATKQFEDALDRAYMQMTTGAFSRNEAIKMAIKSLAVNGVASVKYPSGHTDYMDVAVRRAVLTGVNQTALKLQDARATEMGCDLVETSAHSGARPAHAQWQGKIFSRSGKHPKYPDFVASTGYGTGAGLGGWNCRHSFYPFIEGISEPNYSKAELKEMDSPKYVYNGEKLTEYDATQRQRQIERNLRRWKREFRAMEAVNLPTEEAAAKITSWQRIQKDFLQQTGLKRQHDREAVAGFGKSEASRATAVAGRQLDKYSKLRYNKNGTIIVTDDWTQKKHPTLSAEYKPNAVVDTVSRGGRQRDRMIYDSDGRQKVQINNAAHGNVKRHPFGKQGEHAHDIVWKDGEIISRDPRELTDQERKEHGDMLET